MLLCFLGITVVTAILASNVVIPSTGVISGIGVSVYNDSQGTSNCTNLLWGTVDKGSTTTKTVYIKNTGTVKEDISLTTMNWDPTTARDYISVTGANLTVNAGAIVPYVITLNVSANADGITQFRLDIVINGVG